MQERSFYDMTGGKNIFKYLTTEEKLKGEQSKLLPYLQKSTGLFNQNGMIEQQEIEAMKARLKANTGNIWHGFLSLNEEESPKIDTPEKCIHLVKRTFNSFFKDAGLDEKNIDLMCALHLDKPHHIHLHFCFWEKEPKYRSDEGKSYRKKGKIEKSAIDNMLVRVGMFLDDDKDKLPMSRDEAIRNLKELTCFKLVLSNAELKKEIVSFAKVLPKTGRLSYGSKDMEPFRERIDKLVDMFLSYDEKARKANLQFYEVLAEKERLIKSICGQSQTGKSIYHQKIDDSKITVIKDIEADYKRRQGNLIINLAKVIKPEIFERKQGKRYKTNDNKLKRSLVISQKKIGGLFTKFLSSFGSESENLSKEHRNRLHEIEIEMQAKQRKEEFEQKKEENAIQKNSTYNSFSK